MSHAAVAPRLVVPPVPGPDLDAALRTDRWLVSIGALLIYLAFHARAVDGDAAVYAATVENGAFGVRSIHAGYYLLGWAASALLAPLGIARDEALVLLGAFFSGAAVGLTMLLGAWLSLGRGACLAAGVIFAFAGNTIVQGTTAEIYAVQVVLMLCSYLMWVRERPGWSGLSMAGAIMVSPLSLFGCGPILVSAWSRRRLKALGPWLLACALPPLVVLAWCWQDYWFGPRGLLVAGPDRQFGLRPLLENGFYVLKNFHLGVVLLLVGAILWRARRRELVQWGGALTLGHVPILVSMREQGVFFYPAYPMLSLLMGLGWMSVQGAVERRLGGRGARVMGGAVGAAYAIVALSLWVGHLPETNKQAIEVLARHARAGDVLLTSWEQAVATRYYAPERVASGDLVVISTDLITDPELRRLLDGHRRIFVLERASASRGAKLVLSRDRLERRRRDVSVEQRLRRALDLGPLVELFRRDDVRLLLAEIGPEG